MSCSTGILGGGISFVSIGWPSRDLQWWTEKTSKASLHICIFARRRHWLHWGQCQDKCHPKSQTCAKAQRKNTQTRESNARFNAPAWPSPWGFWNESGTATKYEIPLSLDLWGWTVGMRVTPLDKDPSECPQDVVPLRYTCGGSREGPGDVGARHPPQLQPTALDAAACRAAALGPRITNKIQRTLQGATRATSSAAKFSFWAGLPISARRLIASRS